MRGSAAFRVAVAPGGALAGPWVQNSLWTAARAVPSLDLRFADNKSLVDAVTGASLVTFTRASSGTFVGSDGVLRTAVTNLLLRSEEFDVTWGKPAGVTVTANTTQAPNGTQTADTLSGAINIEHNGTNLSQSITVTESKSYIFSIYVKSLTATTFSIRLRDNMAASVITAVTPTSSWQRVSCTLTTAIGATALVARVGGADGDVAIWGAQLEQSSTVGEYIPTTSTINSAPRFDHNPTTGESLGLLVEEARTNVVTWSQDLSNADWGKAAATIVSTAVASPIQGVNYQKIEATSANTTVGVTSIAVTAATQQRAISFFAQPLGNISRVLVVIQGIDARININLVDGTFTTNAIATGSTVSVSGQRFSVSTPTLTLATGVRFFLKRTGEIDTNTPTTIAIGEGLYLTGAQMEAGAFPTSYIPTTTATVTRAADVASISGSNFSSWYNQTEGTVFADVNTAPVANIAQAVFDLSEGAGSERIFQRRNTSGFIVTAITDNGVVQGDFGSVSVSASGRARSGFAYRLNDFEAAVNGSPSGTDTSATVPTPDRIHIGQNFASGQIANGTIRRLTYWPTRLSNPTLQAISQP